MALYYDLPVFNDTYRLTLKVFELTKHFSREYKFTLGQDMKRDCITLVRSIYRANKTKAREVYLEQFLDEAGNNAKGFYSLFHINHLLFLVTFYSLLSNPALNDPEAWGTILVAASKVLEADTL